MSPACVGLIPARGGSKRVPDKNIRLLAGHPLLAYTVAAALDSGVFDRVIVSTDSARYAEAAIHYGAEVPFLRPTGIAGDTSPDIEWVAYTLDRLAREGVFFDCFSILRPTSPFRGPETIRRAWEVFLSAAGADSLRAVEKCAQHPCKMWRVEGERIRPVMEWGTAKAPGHSSQYVSLPEIYVQNASLEIAWTSAPLEQGSIAGTEIVPFFTRGAEGVDVNREIDFDYADLLVRRGEAALPKVTIRPWAG
ncbi:MAG: acylneuraminate cytidylyltransferase family protein [Pseudodesulfovibrio sp.]